jgi:hypothetical protein
MIDEASAEDIRIAKQHLDRALARAINRDSLRWTNPPAYQVIGDSQDLWPDEDRGFIPGTAVDLDEVGDTSAYVEQEIEEHSYPVRIGQVYPPDVLEWQSLDYVPVGVVVRDKDGDCWKIKPDGKLRSRFKGEKKWGKANVAGAPLSAWDHFGPFTEVKENQ